MNIMNQPNINKEKTPRPEQPKSQERHKSSDGGEFERVLDEVYDLYPTHMKDIRSKEIVSRLVSAYYHDRNAGHAADKQRIAELEAQLPEDNESKKRALYQLRQRLRV